MSFLDLVRTLRLLTIMFKKSKERERVGGTR